MTRAKQTITAILSILALGMMNSCLADTDHPRVTVPPASFFTLVRERDREAARAFYKKYIDVKGMPVVAAGEVSDAALQRTYSIVTHLLAGRPDVIAAMVKDGMYLIIIGKDQAYTDMPEYRNAPNPAYLNERVRGTGGRPSSFGEENLLSLPIDRYDDESIGVHEFCHTIDSALRSIDSTWSERRNTAYRHALSKGLWKGTYAGSNPGEFWAEVCQSYFDCNRVNNWNHGPIGTREQLKAYDPETYELVRTAFNLKPEQDWRYSPLQKLPNVMSPPAKFKIDPYYTKFTWAREFTVVGRQASDAALLKANDTIRKMFAYRHDILKALIADGVKLVVLGRNEKLTDLPEVKSLQATSGFDPLARVLEYTPETKLLVVGEENVLADPSKPLVGGNQILRIFANALYRVTGTRPADPNWNKRGRDVQQYELNVKRLDVQFDEKLKQLYDAAMSKGLWKGTAAVNDRAHYWVEGVLAYFDALGQDAAPNDAAHPVATREALQQYDPALYALVNETMAYEGHVDWRFTRKEASSIVPEEESSVNHPAPASAPKRQPRQNQGGGLVFKDHVTANWFADNTRFWYRNDLQGGGREFILMDSEKGTRRLAFDHARLAAALSKAAGKEFKAERLPFSTIAFSDDGKTVRFEAEDKTWQCDLATYECAPSSLAFTAPAAPRRQAPAQSKGVPLNEAQPGERLGGADRPVTSPDGKWSAVVRDHNVVIRPLPDGQEAPLTQDGNEGKAYGRLQWSPDSKALVAWRIEPGDHKQVHLIRSSPRDGGRAQLQSRAYDLPGDKFTTYEPNVFDIASRKQIKPMVDPYEHEWEPPHIRWNPDGRRFAYDQEDRGHQRFRVIEVDALTGATRNIIDEKTSTFIWTAHTENLNMTYVNWLQKTEEIVYVSEKDGWRHLYLVDAKMGTIKNQITRGEWVVRGIDRIDEDTRQIWFRAGGMNPDQDPYFIHYYRINFDGTGLVALTMGNGTHRIDYSPDRKYLIDTYSRVDMAPMTELRRASDGKLVCKLEEADISALKATGWAPPEVFVAKGRDGKTDIWGIISRPKNFDPAKKYPVLEQIYAGPQGAYVPKAFSPVSRFTSMTDLGFIVVQMDGMGTAFRSKAFHDVCWKNLKDAGFPDRILWHKAVAAKYPYYDLTRVGVYGTSAGGQNAAGAVLFHPEFYKAAVANCGCHDNRMDKASWNEQWMGYPVGPQYSESSNIDNAAKLGGKLFLIVGELDTNVPPEATLRFADALISANKDFDMLVVPGADHGISGPHNAYAQRRTRDFFVHHLLGSER